MENLEFHKRMKHIAIYYHFIHECYEDETITMPYVSFQLQVVNLFTKFISCDSHNFYVGKLMLLEDCIHLKGSVKKV